MMLTGKAKEHEFECELEFFGMGRYILMSDGSVWSTFGNKGKELKQFKKNGYWCIVLQMGKRRKHFYIHRAMAEKFVEGKKDGLEVNHKDGNKLNNSIDNLEWVTRSQNTQHAYDNGLIYRGNRGGDRRSKEAIKKKELC